MIRFKIGKTRMITFSLFQIQKIRFGIPASLIQKTKDTVHFCFFDLKTKDIVCNNNLPTLPRSFNTAITSA